MDYETLDYLPDLTSDAMATAQILTLVPHSTPSVGWDRSASVAGTAPYAILRDLFKFTAIEGATYDFTSVSFFDPYLLRIYDKFGNTIVANLEADDASFNLSDGTYLSDQINDWVAPYSGVYYVSADWNQGAFYTFYALLANEDINTVDPHGGVRLFAADGFQGYVAGFPKVFGTNANQLLKLGIGDYALDPSFNRGGDVVELPGNTEDYKVALSGSNAVLTGYGSTFAIPIGTVGMPLVFDDGSLVLKAIDGVGKLGDQTLSATASTVTATAGADPVATGIDAAAQARVFMAPDTQVELGGNFNVFGTVDEELVSFVGGKVTLDPSFNRGGDTILFYEEATSYTAERLGSTVMIKGAEGSIAIPIGTVGAALDFYGDERMLIYDTAAGHVMIGTQIVADGVVTLG